MHSADENKKRNANKVVRFTPAAKATFIKIANVENAVAATSKNNRPCPFNPSTSYFRAASIISINLAGG